MTNEAGSASVVVGEEVVAAVPAPEMGGLHAGAIVFAGMVAANFGNYIFHLLTARALGPAPYGDVATLATLTGTIGLPLGGVQVFVARHAAARAARGHSLDGDRYVSSFTSTMAIAGLALTGVFLAISPLAQRALSIHSLWAVIFTALFTLPSFVAPALIGAAQGRQRFTLVAVAVGVPPVARIALVGVALVAGSGVPGAMAATFAASAVGVAIPFVALRHELARVLSWRPRISRLDAVALLPVVAGLLAITALSTDDLVVAKAVFSDHEAGLYGSASLIGRVVLYLPAAIVTVLLPKVSSRVAADVDTADILRQSLAVTAAFCVAATAFYAAVPHLIVKVAFGAKFAASANLLWMFAAAMTFYALINVVLTYQLAHGASRSSWYLLGAAVLQAVLFALFHNSPRQILAINIALSGAVLVAHELFVAPTILRAFSARRSD